jgi:hypothetical protein
MASTLRVRWYIIGTRHETWLPTSQQEEGIGYGDVSLG